MKINEIDGLYIAHNTKTNDKVLIGVTRYSNCITAREIAEAYGADYELDGEFDVIEPLPKDLSALKDIEFTCPYLLTEETYNTY